MFVSIHLCKHGVLLIGLLSLVSCSGCRQLTAHTTVTH